MEQSETNRHPLEEQVERIRKTGVLGRSSLMHNLFDYLARCAETGETPREIDIAVEVFGRSEGFDVSQDASVRVYIHRLRQKLDDYYAGEGRGESRRLVIPKGDYRLALEEQESVPAIPAMVEGPVQAPARRRNPWLVAAALVAVLLANVAVWALLWPRPVDDNLAETRQSAFWSPLLKDQRLIIVAVGDYYIFGELGNDLNVQRLVREFSVNSRDDLLEFQMMYPDQGSRYVDMELRYLPTSAAHALARVMPILSPSSAVERRVRVVLSSQLTPSMLKTADIVYVGYLSALGPLMEPVFAGSRFSVGDSFDEIVDDQTGKRYLSEINRYEAAGRTTLDYGLISAFEGPTGNHIVILAGTRDVAIRQVAEEVTDARALKALTPPGEPAFEALFRVEAMEQYNMGAQLIAASPLDQAGIWIGKDKQVFPAE